MISVSLDGYFEDKARGLEWHSIDEELHTHLNVWLDATSAFLEGRVTWELMADYWPAAAEDPAAAPAEREFAPIWIEKPKYLFSRTRQEAGWNTTIQRDVDRALIDHLREQPGGDMVVGGPDLAATFFELDLIDEYRIYVHPYLLGDGHRPFPSLAAGRPLALTETQRFGNGVVLLHYRRR